MGVVQGVAHDQFPAQGAEVGQRVQLTFNYDLDHVIGGTLVRDDMESPFRTIIRLDDGRYVLGTECQYTLIRSAALRRV